MHIQHKAGKNVVDWYKTPPLPRPNKMHVGMGGQR